jgi:hypothetical protein
MRSVECLVEGGETLDYSFIEDQFLKKRNSRHTARNKSLRMKEQAPSDWNYEIPRIEA